MNSPFGSTAGNPKAVASSSSALCNRRWLHRPPPTTPWSSGQNLAHNQLGQYYSPRHEVVAIYCSPHPILPPAIFRFALEDMDQYAPEIHAGFTLYVPPAASRPIQDYDLLAKLYSVDHLRSITRC